MIASFYNKESFAMQATFSLAIFIFLKYCQNKKCSMAAWNISQVTTRWWYWALN